MYSFVSIHVGSRSWYMMCIRKYLDVWYLIDVWTLTPTDLQNVNITLRILFRPMTKQLPRIFTSIGEDYDERVLPSITTEVLKAVVVSFKIMERSLYLLVCLNEPVNQFWKCVCQARFDAGELITQRELVSRQVSEDLTERASTFGLILDDVSLVRSSRHSGQWQLLWIVSIWTGYIIAMCSFRHTWPLAKNSQRP